MEKEQQHQKTDEGFQFFYWNLSYRRKFIRTLWLTVFIPPVLIYVWIRMHSFSVTIITAFILIASQVIQLLYTYRKWKSNHAYAK